MLKQLPVDYKSCDALFNTEPMLSWNPYQGCAEMHQWCSNFTNVILLISRQLKPFLFFHSAEFPVSLFCILHLCSLLFLYIVSCVKFSWKDVCFLCTHKSVVLYRSYCSSHKHIVYTCPEIFCWYYILKNMLMVSNMSLPYLALFGVLLFFLIWGKIIWT